MNLIDNDLNIDKIVEDDIQNSTTTLINFIRSRFIIQLVLSMFISMFLLFISALFVINNQYDKSIIEQRNLYFKYVVVSLLIIIIVYIIWYCFIRYFIKPVFEIKREMEDIKNGNLYKQIEIKGTNELWQLADAYNKMAKELANQKLEVSFQTEERLKAVEAKNIIERKAIENYINTSFIYEIICYIHNDYRVLTDDEKNNIISRLISVLNYINPSYNEDVNIGTEIEWIKDYLFIKRLLSDNSFEYDIDISEELYKWPSLKLLILPYVDNCIIHAFADVKENKCIKIFASESHNRLVLNIWDNGNGISADKLKELNKFIDYRRKNNYATENYNSSLKNSISKLFSYYGERLEFKINSLENDGTCFTIFLPLPNKFSWQSLE